MTDRSVDSTAPISRAPRPYIEKTFSVITAPPSSEPKSRPNRVMTGIITFRSACRPITRASRRPLARAVRT